ncbi:MAG: class I SAM-dependent DNA methyltransferase [Alphaproteobacteria bacterium]
MTDPKAEDLLRRAYALSGEDPAETKALYRDWAETYDGTMMDGLAYVSPMKIAALLAEHVTDRDTRVLDVGCGTGLLATFLGEQGFGRIDGLDYSAEMLAVAQAKGRIGQSFLRDLNEPLNMDGERFGAMASTGTFTHGHVGGGCLPGLFELLEQGGLLVCTVHQDVWDAGGFGETLAQLEEAGAVEIVERKADRLFETDEAPTGWYLVARKR